MLMNRYQEGKSRKRRLLERVLRVMASQVLARYRPTVVGVTGSVGKTSTKEAIALALRTKFSVRVNEWNYNNEVGIPLTILGVRSGGGSFLRWMRVGWRFVILMVYRVEYPKVLVLEMAIDRPGDMEYLLGFLPVSVGVLTNVSGSHLEYFGSLAAIGREKGLLLNRLPKDGTAVVNIDSEHARKSLKRTKARTLTYGTGQDATVRVDQVILPEHLPGGITFRLNYQGTVLPIRLPQIIAPHLVSAAAAAAAVGIAFRLNLVDISQALVGFRTLPGRMRLLEGVNDAFIIDDTYNASPASLHAALETLAALPAAHRLVALGDMLELGPQSASEHRRVADQLVSSGVDRAILIGSRMRLAYEELLRRGWTDAQVTHLDHPRRGGEMLRQWLGKDDIVLVKGSQGMRMEIITEGIIAHPGRAGKLLCRQSDEWKRLPFTEND